MIFSINPATGETIATFEEHGPDVVEAALEGGGAGAAAVGGDPDR
jgi:hypothetical protein